MSIFHSGYGAGHDKVKVVEETLPAKAKSEDTKKLSAKALIITALAPILWGTTFILATDYSPPGSPLLLAAARALPAGILLIAIHSTWPRQKYWGKLLVLSLLNIGAYFALLFFASYQLSGGTLGAIGASSPFLTALAAWIIVGKKPKVLTFLAASVGIGGILCLVLGPEANLTFWGVLTGVLAIVSIAIGNIYTKKWNLPLAPLSAAGWQLLLAGIALLLATVTIEGAPPHITSAYWLSFGYSSLLATGLAYICFFYGLKHLPTSIVVVLTLLTPLVATAIDWIVLDKPLDRPIQWVGAGLIILAFLIEARSSRASKNKGEDQGSS